MSWRLSVEFTNFDVWYRRLEHDFLLLWFQVPFEPWVYDLAPLASCRPHNVQLHQTQASSVPSVSDMSTNVSLLATISQLECDWLEWSYLHFFGC